MQNETSLHDAIIKRLATLDDLCFTDIISDIEYSVQCAKLNECLYQLSLKKEENEDK